MVYPVVAAADVRGDDCSSYMKLTTKAQEDMKDDSNEYSKNW